MASLRWFTKVQRSKQRAAHQPAHQDVGRKDQPRHELPGPVVVAERGKNGQGHGRKHAERIPNIAKAIQPAALPGRQHTLGTTTLPGRKIRCKAKAKTQQRRNETDTPQRGVPMIVLLPGHGDGHAHQGQRRQTEPTGVLAEQFQRRGRPAKMGFGQSLPPARVHQQLQGEEHGGGFQQPFA